MCRRCRRCRHRCHPAPWATAPRPRARPSKATLQHAVAELHDECRRLQEEGALYPGLSIGARPPRRRLTRPPSGWTSRRTWAAYAEHGIDRFAVVVLGPGESRGDRGAGSEAHAVRIVPTRYAGPTHGVGRNVAAPHPLLPGGCACALLVPHAVVAHVNSLAWCVTF